MNHWANNKYGQTHGMKYFHEYKVWEGLKQRCNNINNPGYNNYGGRGIKLCSSWNNSFESFYKDMGNCPEGCSIDRINNDEGYYKSNCRWTTRRIQNLNQRL